MTPDLHHGVGADQRDLADAVHAWNRTDAAYPRELTIDVLLDDVAAAHADHLAVCWDGGSWTYAEFVELSDRIAGGLIAAGVTADTVVALIGPRSAQACAAMVAVLKTGAAYLPLDESLPEARLHLMVEIARPVVGIRLPGAGEATAGLLPIADFADLAAHAPAAPDRKGADPGSAAYVMFTSGTTGRPKAVVVTHRGVVRLSVNNGFFRLRPQDRVMHAASISFDAATLELWPTLLNGATVLIAETELLLAAAALRTWIDQRKPTALFVTTSVFHRLALDRPDVFAGIGQVLTGGEAMNPHLARQVLRHGPPGRLVNCYGPTENTVVATAHDVTEVSLGDADVPIGRPIANTTCYVMTADGALAPPGAEGELYVGGDGLATGYLDDPAETAARFVTAAPTGRPLRLYRTGDIVTWSDDGVLHYRGRNDQQAKVRGVRLNLDEISTALSQCDGVGNAAVVTVDDEVSRTLVAFYTAADAVSAPTRTVLRRQLAGILPAVAVPAGFHLLPQIPLQPSGKVDEAALRRLAVESSAPVDRTGAELPDRVASLWREVLRLGGTAVGADFFDDGGDSLRAAQLTNQVIVSLGLDPAYGRYLIDSLLRQPSLDGFTDAVARAAGGIAAVDGGAEDDARWLADIHLHAAGATADREAPQWRNPEHLLLTGGTGFFGSYLLRSLLDRTGSQIHCLVRARDDAHALARLQQAQQRYGHRGGLPLDRVRAVAGDLRTRRFGWDDQRWQEFTTRIDVVHHSGAHVNFIYPYEALRPTNVDGVRNLIEFARTGRGIPVHYISTIAVLAGSGSAGIGQVTEDTPLGHVQRLSMGYPESKWVAEQLLRTAYAEGLPVVIHRPYEISGNTVDGTWNTEAAICAFFKAIAEMGSAPDIDLPLDFVPADYLADAVAHLATTRAPAGQTYHLTNPQFASLDAMVRRLRAHGYPVAVQPYRQWVGALTEFAADHPEHPIVAFVPIFTNHAAARDITVKELYVEGTFPAFTRTHADRDLADAGLTCPPVDADMLDGYIAYFQRCGFLAPATAGLKH
ncbi:amino acid adenylation domain-containing protein/thioester reductase-like protein [Allocatelliglobosispora scoriae]|uniref:Amino acid adenylation domain-containing protein/thioester reductase-like protein n=1 Tax=Allocatelliglobosispora scoriae TaxID=643052 RepID=A0A841BIV1_9ACTN|nr:amino acid adenylation domain-containing protein [Allocatelliglobosispora scoriae]MBB5866831.1 amino acid adenylation domain-containing protein/thioester reductase-like protein [Allocatelliglobosispora scoriae]